jgi:hypothetical protein
MHSTENVGQEVGIAGACLEKGKALLHAVKAVKAFEKEFARQVVHMWVIGRLLEKLSGGMRQKKLHDIPCIDRRRRRALLGKRINGIKHMTISILAIDITSFWPQSLNAKKLYAYPRTLMNCNPPLPGIFVVDD